MAPKTPVEHQSLRVPLLICGLAMVAVTAWVLYDEAVVRRPWKTTQESFNAHEVELLEAAMAAEEERLATPEQAALGAAAEADAAARHGALEEPEYREAEAKLAELDRQVRAVERRLAGAKSRRDEAFYVVRHAREVQGDVDGALVALQPHLDEVASIEGEVAALQAQRAEAQKQADVWLEPLKAAEKTLAEHYKIRTELRGKLEAARSRALAIQQVVVPALGSVDRCQTCHMAIDRPGFESSPAPFATHPDRDSLLNAHPVATYGCTICHAGQGPQVKGIDGRPFDHGRDDPYWEKPMLEGVFVQSTCARCHGYETPIPGAPVFNEGRDLFANLGCVRCHEAGAMRPSIGLEPPLTQVWYKTTAEVLETWIRHPQGVRPGARMPNFWPDAVDAQGVDLPGTPAYQQRARELVAILAFLQHTATSGEPVAWALPPKTEGGETLLREAGCPACHDIGLDEPKLDKPLLVGRDFAPPLTKHNPKLSVGWVYQWLRDPRAYNPESRMPSPRLTEQQAAALAWHLGSVEGAPQANGAAPAPAADLVDEGEKLVRDYGCFGCHEIGKMRAESKVGVNLTDFGVKPVSQFDFCDVITVPEEKTWTNFVKVKLAAPRAFTSEQVVLRMPAFNLRAEQIDALTVFLASLRDERSPEGYTYAAPELEAALLKGEALLSAKNCRGCHVIGKTGGRVQPLYADPLLAPPPLVREGAKVQPAWLERFIRDPVPMRPWLGVGMPNYRFTREEAMVIVRYFLAENGETHLYPDDHYGPLDGEQYVEAKMLFDALKCAQCHAGAPSGDLKLTDLAPDLAISRERLRPSWIRLWLADPQLVQEGTRMPTYFAMMDPDEPELGRMSPVPFIVDGNVDRQIAMLTDFLNDLGRVGAIAKDEALVEEFARRMNRWSEGDEDDDDDDDDDDSPAPEPSPAEGAP